MPKYTVTFKETYNDKEVTQWCVVHSLQEVIRIYGLDQPDIEYWKLVSVEEV